MGQFTSLHFENSFLLDWIDCLALAKSILVVSVVCYYYIFHIYKKRVTVQL